jgi:hypothetical protein
MIERTNFGELVGGGTEPCNCQCTCYCFCSSCDWYGGGDSVEISHNEMWTSGTNYMTDGGITLGRLA